MFTASELKRKFKYGEIVLADPGENFSLEQVKEFYTAQYPELNNSAISSPNVVGESLVYNFTDKSANYGTKG